MTDSDASRALSREDFLYPRSSPNRTGGSRSMPCTRCTGRSRGNPRGVPVVFLHGGPGGGSSPDHRRFFDPAFYRIIVYDQRGAGQSTPLGELADNTTAHLVADLERLREHLSVERWLVFGGSWGSTLALAYARGASGARARRWCCAASSCAGRWRSSWFLYDMRFLFPEAWRAFAGFFRRRSAATCSARYYRRLIDPDPACTCRRRTPGAATKARARRCCRIRSWSRTSTRTLWRSRSPASRRITSSIDIFLPDNALLADIDRIRHIPCAIVQGRYDVVCPIVSADELHRAWPEAEYVVVPDAGHSAREPGIARELVAATNRFRGRE